jgi:hypothetical protein
MLVFESGTFDDDDDVDDADGGTEVCSYPILPPSSAGTQVLKIPRPPFVLLLLPLGRFQRSRW